MPMPLIPAVPDNNMSERRFLLAVLLIGLLAGLTIVIQLVGREQLLGRLAGAAFWVEIALELTLIGVIVSASPRFIREMRRRHVTAVDALEARSQIESLFRMTDMLQSALGHADANAVLRSTAARLMPGFGGALYVFNNSGDRLELSTSWNWPEGSRPSELIAPSQCWAIKRGKLHLNLDRPESLCCEHRDGSLVTMEIPMMTRGEVYGLLIVERGGENPETELDCVVAIANALADAMSLSLSNLALRDRLRTQALRDGLTGLYNRRYLEDAFQRCADQAARTQSPFSVIMIDFDHFKQLNDEHGHAMGDAVLTEAAAEILATIRPCDIACRYGGEELTILLPDCSLADALDKAEVLRARIERLSDRHGVSISASFGVASVPQTSGARDVSADADRALYLAKQQGRNRVVAAGQRSPDAPPAAQVVRAA